MRERVRISAAAQRVLTEAVREVAPNEACGALIGTCQYGEWWEIESARPLHNHAAQPSRAYLIPSNEVRALERAASAADAQIVGFFHSHPVGNAPSATDLQHAWPGYVYLIADGSTMNPELRAFTLADDGTTFEPLELQIA